MKIRVNPFIAGYLVALIALASLGYCLSDYAIEKEQLKKETLMKKNFISDTSFVSLPQVNMAITSRGGKSGRLRMNIGLEVQQKNVLTLEGVSPIIAERVISYMQRLSQEDIKQIDATPWRRKELLEEVNSVSYPIPVIDLVFRQLVIL